jgi:UDP-glucose 4-epimerase
VRIVVTGASGFVGRALARRLPLLGHEVVSVSRSDPPPGVAAVRWSGIADADALRTALRGADALVHLAARVHVMRDDAPDPLGAFRQVNVEGTRIAAEVARELGVPRAILMSTIKVLGEGRASPYTDTDHPAPADAYAVSKLEAERVFSGTLGPAATVLRPCLVYGPGVGGNFARLLRIGVDLAGLPLPLGRASGPRSLVFADNLADMVASALASTATGGRSYVIADAERPTTAELLRMVAHFGGRRAVLMPIPEPVLRAAGTLCGRSAGINRVLGSLMVDASRFRQDTGWQQAFTLASGLELTVGWWRRGRGAASSAPGESA